MDEDRTSLCDLLDRAREGDESARNELFDRCRSYVNVVARAQVESWLRTKVDASDLVQQTLMEAHQGFADFRGNSEGEWLAWLKRILSHNAADYVRRYHTAEKRRANREIPMAAMGGDKSGEYQYDPSDPGDSPSELVMRYENEIEVADAIARLPDDYRDVIMLRNLQRLPFSEVAQQMGRSRPAVQMLWMRAIKKLEEVLKS